MTQIVEIRVTTMSTSTRAIISLQGLDIRVLTVESPSSVSDPTSKLEPFIGDILPVMNLHDWQKPSGKADQLTASGGREHA